MRFDTLIELFILEDIQDGLGGHIQSERYFCSRYAKVEYLSLETTVKIYGDALTQNVKAIILGDMARINKIKIDGVMYKVISQRKIKNKTSFFLDEDEKKIQNVIKNSSMTIERNAKSNLTSNKSVKTGHLRRGIATNIGNMEATVHTSNIKYAVMVEKGTKAHIIKPKNKKALYWKGASHPVKQVNHPGSKAKPYLIPAFDKEVPYFVEKLKEVVEW